MLESFGRDVPRRLDLPLDLDGANWGLGGDGIDMAGETLRIHAGIAVDFAQR